MESSKDESAKKKEKKEKEGRKERGGRIRIRADVGSVSSPSAEGEAGIPALLRADDEDLKKDSA